MKFNSVTVAPVRSLEIGDLIAKELVGDVTSGKVTGIAHYGYQLTEEQRSYMVEHKLTIPTNEYAELAGKSYCILFGNFSSVTLSGDTICEVGKHMYIDINTNVAVFPTKD